MKPDNCFGAICTAIRTKHDFIGWWCHHTRSNRCSLRSALLSFILNSSSCQETPATTFGYYSPLVWLCMQSAILFSKFCLSVCLSLSNAGTMCLKEWSYQHSFWFWHPGRGVFSTLNAVRKFQGNSLSRGVRCLYGGGKILQKLPFISKTVRDRATVTMGH